LAPRNDIAIYAPFAFAFYEDRASSAGGVHVSERRKEQKVEMPRGGGGAELQTRLLAEALAQKGLRVAHILYERNRQTTAPLPALELIKRKPWAGRRDLLGKLSEALRVWRSLADAGAHLYLFRGGGAHLMVGVVFCFLHRRGLVVSASNDLDFIFDRPDRSRWGQALYRVALRRSQCVVVQTAQQLELARQVLGTGARVELIPSFAEPASDRADNRGEAEEAAGMVSAAPEPEGFLWAARLVPYKLPLRYVDLARALPEARFWMVAPWTSETPEALLEQLTEAADATPNLELLPNQYRDKVLEMISRSAAVVVTSSYEGMPNVFLEAWARGVPVISLHFDPDGRIADEGLGLFAHGSWDEFVSAARRLWAEPELRRQMGDRGRAYVARVHSPEAVGERWAEALREALG
jgi:glycosyltransferase involved in cell wall biosynthesis